MLISKILGVSIDTPDTPLTGPLVHYKMKPQESPLVWVLWVLYHPPFLKLWVLATMVFGKYSHGSINFYKNGMENVVNLLIPWQKSNTGAELH